MGGFATGKSSGSAKSTTGLHLSNKWRVFKDYFSFMNIVTHHQCGCGIEHRIQKDLFKSKDPNKKEFEQYKVKLGDRYTPVMDEYHAMAAAMDDNNNGIISSEEIHTS